MATARRGKGSGTLFPRGSRTWLIRIDYGRSPVTGKRDRRNVTFSGTKAAAQKKMNELLSQRDQGVAVPPDKMTVAEWLNNWLTRHHVDGRITDRVRDRYQGIIDRHLIPMLGRMRLQELRPTHIAEAKARWLEGGDGSTSAEPLQPATVYKHMVVLRQSLAEAVRHNLISRNPTDAVARPSVTRRTEQRALTEDEIRDLVETATGTRFDVPVRLTLATGLRQSELLKLRWADVELQQAAINVAGTKTANSRRRIELSARMVEVLRSHRQEQRKRRLRLGASWTESGLVFPSSRGTPWNRYAFYRDYKALLRKADIEDPASVTWHTLRHTAASQWIRHGADIFTVSRRLGHASAAFTMDVYAHLLRGQQRVAAEALDHLLA